MLTRKLTRRITQALTRKATEPGIGGAASFNPATLFASGQKGAWYDPSDFSTLFQDSAGTTPVTAAGQPVGYVGDKSGNGRNLLQATSAARPTLQQDGSGNYYLSFDGVDDFISATGMTQTTDMDAMFGMQHVGRCAVYHSAYSTSNYACTPESENAITHTANTGPSVKAYVNGVIVSPQMRDAINTAWPDNTTSVVEMQEADLLTSWGGGFAFGFYPGFGGFRRLYSGILRENMTAQELLEARGWVANKCGVTL